MNIFERIAMKMQESYLAARESTMKVKDTFKRDILLRLHYCEWQRAASCVAEIAKEENPEFDMNKLVGIVVGTEEYIPKTAEEETLQ